MKHPMLLVLAAVALTAAPAAGQSISQGMTSREVQAQFGAPATTREAGQWTYWYYHNGCPNRCGSDDVVFFQNDRVVAAVLRTSRRRYSGPRADAALQAADDGTSGVHIDAAPVSGRGVRVGGVRVEPAEAEVIIVPGPADDPGGTPVQAREGRPGEPSTIVIGAGEPEPGSVAAPATAPAVDATQPGPDMVEDAAAPAANVEATDTRGETSIDRKNRRNVRDRSNEPTATERARANDRRGNP